MFLYIMVQKYLQAQVSMPAMNNSDGNSVAIGPLFQSIVWPFALVGLLANIISATLHGVLMFGAGLGLM